MTEEEARTRWCPMYRVVVDPSSQSLYGNMLNPGAMTCAASLCMAWRWFDESSVDGVRDNQQRGHCGLAGSP